MNSSPPNPARFSVDPSAAQALGFLWRGRWWIVLATIVASALGVFYAQGRGTIWRARSMLYVEDGGGPVILGNVLRQPYVNTATTQAELMRSIPILEAALEREGIGGNPVFGGKENELVWLKSNLKVSVGEESGLITVSLDSPYLAEACNVVNAIVDSYRDFHAEHSQKTSSQILEGLTAELTKFEADLETEQNKQIEFLKENPGVGVFSDAANVALQRFGELNVALTQAELASIEAESAWRSSKQLVDSPELLLKVPIQPPAAGAEGAVLQQLREMQTRRSQLLAEVTPEHPLVLELERTMADLAAAHVDAMEQQFLIAEKKYEDLRQKLQDHEQKIMDFDPKQAEYKAMEMRIERTRLIADALFQRIREININQSLDDPQAGSQSAIVVERASPKGAMVASSKSTIMLIAGFVGLVLGAGIAWMLSLFDQRLRTPEDVAEQLPLFSTIPRVSVHRHGAIETWRKNPEFAEAMRSLRTAVYFDTRSVKSKTIQITSPESRDGKSITTAGLGIAMAQAGQRTLVIDADFRNPSQPTLLGGIPNEVGLVEILSSSLPLHKLATVQTDIENLHVLPSGPLTDNPTELLNSPRLAEVIRELAKRFDRILIDSPPLLRIADARIISAVCDETLIVLRSGKTTWKTANTACSAVVSVGGRLGGAILNGAPREVSHSAGSLQPLEPHLASGLDRYSKAT